MPKKAESTKRQYRRKGYDTDRFLIATGRATRVKWRKRGNDAVEIYPQDPEQVLAYNVPDRAEWFEFTDNVEKIVLDTTYRRLVKNG